MPRSRPVAGRPRLPYLMAALTILLMGLVAAVWALESRSAARAREEARLLGLSDAFAAHVGLTLGRYMDLLQRAGDMAEDRDIPPPRLLSEILRQNPYLLGIRLLENHQTLTALERGGSTGALSWPAFHGPYGAPGSIDIHMHVSGLLHLHRYLDGARVVEMVIDRQALLNALAPLVDTPGRSVGLFAEDGLILARAPHAPKLRQEAVPPPRLRPDGRLVETRLSPFDGLDRLVAWTRVEGQPLLLAATMPLDTIYAEWRRQTVGVGALWALLTLAALVVAHRLARASAAAQAAVMALARNEAELRSLFHQNLQLLGFLNTDGRTRRINETALKVAGVGEGDVIGLPFWETPWWRHDAPARARLRAAITAAAGGETTRFTLTAPGADGGDHVFEVSLSPVAEGDGRITGLLAEGRDITARLAAERDATEQRQRLEMALESTEQAIWDWNVVTGAVVFSRQLAVLLGQEPETWRLRHDDWMARIHPDDLPAVAAAGADHVAGRTPLFDTEYRVRRSDGDWLWVLDRAKVVERDPDGAPLRVVGALSDITARRENEERLRGLARALEDSNRNLEQFAYVASHDLQEPLRMVSSYLGLLRRRKGHLLDAEALEFIGFASDGALRMSQLITDLLDYSRVTTRGDAFAPVPLSRPIATALSNLTIAVAESKARVDVAARLPTVHADAGQLTQLFQNLIGNAIKYARPGIPPRVQVEAAATEGGCRITVRDNGIGIEPPYRERIFRLFQRLHGRDAFSGTGIGLAVAQRIVERHGGRIWVEDAVPGDWTHGTAFVFDLPARADQALGEDRGEGARVTA